MSKKQQDKQDSKTITKESIIKELSIIAFSDYSDYFSTDKGQIKLKALNELTEEQRKAIKKIKQNAFGSYDIELYDKFSAIEKISKMLGYDTSKTKKEDTDPLDCFSDLPTW